MPEAGGGGGDEVVVVGVGGLPAFSQDAYRLPGLCEFVRGFLRIGFSSHWSRNLSMGSEKAMMQQ